MYVGVCVCGRVCVCVCVCVCVYGVETRETRYGIEGIEGGVMVLAHPQAGKRRMQNSQ